MRSRPPPAPASAWAGLWAWAGLTWLLARRTRSAFGIKNIKPQPILKAAGPLFDHKDAAVRDKAKDLAVELTRWMGAMAVRRDLTDKMRDAQKKEVEEALEAAAAEGGRPAPSRCLRRDAARLAEMQAEAGAAGAVGTAAAGAKAGAVAAVAQPDGWEFCEPEDILPRLGRKDGEKPAFWDGAVSANWKERHAAFVDLKEWASAPRLAPGDFGEARSLPACPLMAPGQPAGCFPYFPSARSTCCFACWSHAAMHAGRMLLFMLT